MTNNVERRGEVVGFGHGMAQVRMQPASGCSACGSRSTCSTGHAAGQVINLSLPGHIQLGDQIAVTMPAASIAQAALIGYLLPPVALLLGALIAATCFEGDAAAVLGAGLGFSAGLLLVRLISNHSFGRGLAPFACDPEGAHLPGADHRSELQTGENT